MWIIPNNLTVSPSVRATLESSWDLKELSRILEPSVMWRSKPSLARTWLQRLNRVSWLKHLSGRILKPSMDGPFVTEYTSSLAVIPASPSQSRDSEKEQTTPDTFGRILNESFRQLNLFGASLRTLEDTLVLDSPKFIEAYEIWVTQLRQDCLQRQRSARHTRENDYSSLPDYKKRRKVPTRKGDKMRWETTEEYWKRMLETEKSWATPNTMDMLPSRSYEAMKNQATNGGRKNRQRPGNLREQIDPLMCQAYQDAQAEANNWPTPAHRDYKGQSGAGFKERHHKDKPSTLPDMIDGLLAPDNPSTNGKNQELWSTPRAVNIEESMETIMDRRKRTGQGYSNISAEVNQYQKGELNPAWVEQLMGLEIGRTDLGSWETE